MYLIIFLFFCFATKLTATISKIRGVSLAKMSLYSVEGPFTCFDGSTKIPIDWINDDYCDCRDGSDEPGTAACENSQFYCDNIGFKGQYLKSSRVNDMICDCCDGSDEWANRVNCTNTCEEFGRSVREEEERLRKVIEEGHRHFQEYSAQGQRTRLDKELKLKDLESQLKSVEAQRNDVEAQKKAAEEPEKEAKERHEKTWQELKQERQSKRQQSEIETAFRALDADSDGKLTQKEMAEHLEFDIDGNGEVSEEEAREYLADNGEVSVELFNEKVWPLIKDIVKISSPSTENFEKQLDEVANATDTTATPPASDEQMPPYDEATQQLIATAEKLRSEFSELQNKYRDIENEVSELKKLLAVDAGASSEFVPLYKQCFEYSDNEYTYKLCLYDQCTQRSKSSGSESTLGYWGKWATDGDKYDAMIYENGLSCWNGPARSTKVKLRCALSNALVSASEPSRCEYEYLFDTPAACRSPALSSQADSLRDEL